MSEKEPKLLGNGKLTVAARLSSVGGFTLASFGLGALAWIGSILVDDLRTFQYETRTDLTLIKAFMSAAAERSLADDKTDFARDNEVTELKADVRNIDRRVVGLRRVPLVNYIREAP